METVSKHQVRRNSTSAKWQTGSYPEELIKDPVRAKRQNQNQWARRNSTGSATLPKTKSPHYRRGSSGDAWRSTHHDLEEVNWRHKEKSSEKTYDTFKQDSPKEASRPAKGRQRNRRGQKQSQARRSSMDYGTPKQAASKFGRRRHSSAGPDTPFPDSYYKSANGVDIDDQDWKNVLVAAIRKSWEKPIEVPESIILAVFGKTQMAA